MSTRAAAVCVSLLTGLVIVAVPAEAQYRVGPSSSATGENYNVEITGNLWNATPQILITSESFPGVPGSSIDFIEELGIEKKWLMQLKVVLRPATKHKFRFEYTPIKYDAEAVLARDIIFNGVLYPISISVESELIWRAYRFAYEYDFVYRDRGFVGVVLEAKYTDVTARLTNGLDSEFIRARAPIPAIGVIGRGYVAPNIAITGEFTFFTIPDIDEDYDGHYFDFDLYGTVNFTENVGVQAGYRSFDVVYKIESDDGDLKVKGLYFGGVVRF